MKKKKALIFGVTGQDGSYLTELLIRKKYEVHGVVRRASTINTKRIDHIYQDPFKKNKSLFLYYGDISDSLLVFKLINSIKPDEIYNLAAQSHVQVSFDNPEYTANVDALGSLRILESIKSAKLINKTKFYQAGTSEMFGSTKDKFQNEKSLFLPQSPYAASKIYSHWITKIYRESYGIFASNGILFNHESPRRGETFVTQKIVKGLKQIKRGIKNKLYLGNLYSIRDWGHAKDYVEGMWKILQYTKSDDWVLATGQICSVKDFVNKVCKKLDFHIIWKGKGLNEKGICKITKKIIIEISKKYFRPLDVVYLRGDSKKARLKLGWKPKYNLDTLIEDMLNNKINLSD